MNPIFYMNIKPSHRGKYGKNHVYYYCYYHHLSLHCCCCHLWHCLKHVSSYLFTYLLFYWLKMIPELKYLCLIVLVFSKYQKTTKKYKKNQWLICQQCLMQSFPTGLPTKCVRKTKKLLFLFCYCFCFSLYYYWWLFGKIPRHKFVHVIHSYLI